MSDQRRDDDNSFKAYRERKDQQKRNFGRGDGDGKGRSEGKSEGKSDGKSDGKRGYRGNGRSEVKREAHEDYIVGIHPVMEAISGGRTINRIIIERTKRSKPVHELIVLAKEKGIPVQEVDRQKLQQVAGDQVHQGVAANISPFAYVTLEEVIEGVKEGDMVVALDHLTDVHNFGSVLRTCEAAGVAYVIIPERRSVQVNATVAKTSAGAIEHVKVARVSSLSQALTRLKEAGFWVIGADMAGDRLYQEADYSGKVVLVSGSEGAGMGRHIRQLCDFVVQIPMVGMVNSLNVSVATSLLVYEWKRQKDAPHR